MIAAITLGWVGIAVAIVVVLAIVYLIRHL